MHPEARRIAGASWLYNTASYRSIFPAAHVRSPVVRTGMTSFQGSSNWGQFLDHRGGVKANLRHEFLTNLDAFDGTQPWRLFPMPTLLVNSPIEVFDD